MSSKSPKWNSLGDFLKAKEERERESQEPSVATSPPTAVPIPTPVTPVTPVPDVTPVTEEIAPRRDFTRTPNSLVRDAIPAGIFTGKCKQLYDYLYSQTRGSIVPTRSARIPTDRVMKGAGMTRHTFRAHIHRLISFGLVVVEERPGEHGGNIYTVFLPEERADKKADRSDRGDRGHTGEKVPVVQGSQVHPCDRGLSLEESTVSGEPKTLFKTNDENDDDDAALAGLNAALKAAAREITGREPSAVERERWGELGELLAAELKIAAARTGSVSNVPAFLTEHLRRRLWKKDKKQLAAEAQPVATGAHMPSKEEISRCPDCGGSGFYYPHGFEAGVAKCRHERLQNSEGQPSASS